MIRFLHITDLHISAPQPGAEGTRSRNLARLEKVIAVAEEMRPKPGFVVVSGDLTNMGDEASYRLVAATMAKLSVPVVYALGNHDRRAGFHAVFPGHAGAPAGPLDHDAVHAGVHVIALDSSVPGKVGGALDDAQFERLEQMLSRHGDLPKVVTVHHPPKMFPGSGRNWSTLAEETTERLASALDGHDVRALLSGHVHMNRAAVWHGVPVVITMGQDSTIDLTRASGLTIVEGAGFAVCDLLPSGLQTTFASLSEGEVIKHVPEERLKLMS